MQLFDILYLLNVFCVWFSWRVATKCFNEGNTVWAYFNIGASALNAAIVINHFV